MEPFAWLSLASFYSKIPFVHFLDRQLLRQDELAFQGHHLVIHGPLSWAQLDTRMYEGGPEPQEEYTSSGCLGFEEFCAWSKQGHFQEREENSLVL